MHTYGHEDRNWLSPVNPVDELKSRIKSKSPNPTVASPPQGDFDLSRTRLTRQGQRTNLLHQRELVPNEVHLVHPASSKSEDGNSLHTHLLSAGRNRCERSFVRAGECITDDN